MSIYDEQNPDWDPPISPDWEPWEPDECAEVWPTGCEYCGSTDVRDIPEPFGGRQCCEACFLLLIDGKDPIPFTWLGNNL